MAKSVGKKAAAGAADIKPTIVLQEKRSGTIGLSVTPSDQERLARLKGQHLFKMPDATLALQVFRIGLDCIEDLATKHAVSSALR